MQFKVPQFLDIEDKIFGPFTFRQFAYMAGGAGFCYFFYKLLGLLWGAIPILIIAGMAGALTFYRPNNKPLMNMVEAWFKYFTQNKLYILKRNKEKPGGSGKQKILTSDEEKIKMMSENGVGLSGSKLRDLAWSLDVLDLSKEKNQERE